MFSAWRSSAGAPLIIRLVEAPFSAAGPTKSRTKSLCSPTRLLPTSPSRSRHSPSSDPSTREVVEKNIPIKSVFNHRVSFAFYFDDPDGNMIEVYWPTGDLSWRQPQAEPLDLSQPDEVLLEKITATP